MPSTPSSVVQYKSTFRNAESTPNHRWKLNKSAPTGTAYCAKYVGRNVVDSQIRGALVTPSGIMPAAICSDVGGTGAPRGTAEQYTVHGRVTRRLRYASSARKLPGRMCGNPVSNSTTASGQRQRGTGRYISRRSDSIGSGVPQAARQGPLRSNDEADGNTGATVFSPPPRESARPLLAPRRRLSYPVYSLYTAPAIAAGGVPSAAGVARRESARLLGEIR